MSEIALPCESSPWRIELDGKSLPFWYEDGKMIVQGYVDENNNVVPTPRPDLYTIRVACTAEIFVKISQDGPAVEQLSLPLE